MKSFSGDQINCLMILNKSSVILQNRQQCQMGWWLFMNTAKTNKNLLGASDLSMLTVYDFSGAA